MPEGLALGADGRLYVADTANHAVRLVTPGGVVSTRAGTGVAGAADGLGTAATFFSPAAVASDGEGVVYVADTGNGLVRALARDGRVSTLGGTPGGGTWARVRLPRDDAWLRGSFRGAAALDGAAPGNASALHLPRGLAVPASGAALYIADTDDATVRILAGGALRTLLGSGESGTRTGYAYNASLLAPMDVALGEDGTLYVLTLGGDGSGAVYAATCAPCAPGHTCSDAAHAGGVPAPCPAGAFCPGGNASAESCSALGTEASPALGAPNASAACSTRCAPGTYLNTTGPLPLTRVRLPEAEYGVPPPYAAPLVAAGAVSAGALEEGEYWPPPGGDRKSVV
jgi:hypothetical protein